MRISGIRLCLLGFVAVLLASPVLAHEGIHVADPYARVTGETAVSGAVFFVIENHGPNPDRLLSAKSDAAELVELHTHSQDANGVMSMGVIEGGIEVPGNSSHALERGGDHVMLMGLVRPLKDGDVINLTLTFENEGDVVVEVPVDNARKPGAAGQHGGGHTTH